MDEMDLTQDEHDAAEETVAQRKGKGKAEGEGAQGYVKLLPQKAKEVLTTFKALTGDELMARVAEFIGELPARVSANLQIVWESVSNGFAIINKFLRSAQAAKLMLNPTRENIQKLQVEYGITYTGPAG